ncbi:mycothiol conjugate amidase Mca [Gryllotalpicola ginsengisoli]|uniref:mycothiol conjugate amidase Mca n=1 Tax=Gryllotalpicola ginsengisoli TaxID=444608 RepID=UPI00052533B2|nr:mycothiol conjugate amidase Mca [Gryllotalpicola ginsengisoli]
MAVHAHPDDESSKGAATYARYLAEGAEVMVVSCTGGQRGDILNPAVEDVPMAHRDIAGLRRIEMAAAQAAVGFEHRWLGYFDSGLPEADEPLPANCFALIPVEISAAPLVRLIREFRPHVLTSYDEQGGYPHPDHIRSHDVAAYALEAAADPERYPEAGEPWQVLKYYYDRLFSTQRARAIYQRLTEVAPDSPLLEEFAKMRRWMEETPYLATTRVYVGDHLEARDAALRAHASQVAPDHPFFFWPNDVVREAWPTDDYQLIDAKVPVVTPETDLFAGIPEGEAE